MGPFDTPAILEFLTQRHKVRTQPEFLGTVRLKDFVLFLLQQFHYTSATWNHLKDRYSQLTWKELTSLISSQFIHLVSASFIITNPIFPGIIFSIKRFFKKGRNQDEAIASSCLMLATALFVSVIVGVPIVILNSTVHRNVMCVGCLAKIFPEITIDWECAHRKTQVFDIRTLNSYCF